MKTRWTTLVLLSAVVATIAEGKDWPTLHRDNQRSGWTDEVVAGLSVLTGMAVPVILQVIAAQSPRALCALAWTAGMSALFAAELQIHLGQIAAAAAIGPAANGKYRLTEDEMRWQMDMFASLDGGG